MYLHQTPTSYELKNTNSINNVMPDMLAHRLQKIEERPDVPHATNEANIKAY
jgi:hypothetical protein